LQGENDMPGIDVNLQPVRYNYTPQDAIVGGETQLQYSTDGKNWKPLRGVTAYGETGETASFIDQTTVEDSESRYLAGKADTPDKTLTGYLYPDDADQAAFLALAEARENVLISIFWKNGNAVTFVMALGGRIDPEVTADGLMTWQVNGKQSGKAKRWTGLTVNSNNENNENDENDDNNG
jgi:hypothetical protein